MASILSAKQKNDLIKYYDQKDGSKLQKIGFASAKVGVDERLAKDFFLQLETKSINEKQLKKIEREDNSKNTVNDEFKISKSDILYQISRRLNDPNLDHKLYLQYSQELSKLQNYYETDEESAYVKTMYELIDMLDTKLTDKEQFYIGYNWKDYKETGSLLENEDEADQEDQEQEE